MFQQIPSRIRRCLFNNSQVSSADCVLDRQHSPQQTLRLPELSGVRALVMASTPNHLLGTKQKRDNQCPAEKTNAVLCCSTGSSKHTQTAQRHQVVKVSAVWCCEFECWTILDWVVTLCSDVAGYGRVKSTAEEQELDSPTCRRKCAACPVKHRLGK